MNYNINIHEATRMNIHDETLFMDINIIFYYGSIYDYM